MMNTWLARSLTPVPSSKPTASPKPSTFISDVCAGLCRGGQKSLPPKYLYDELGSILFDAITRLPEYAVWRAERRLLNAHAHEIAAISRPSLVVELGSGSAEKTRPVLEAMLARGQRVTYCPIEISESALEASRRALDDLDAIDIRGIAKDYLVGLEEALRGSPRDEPALVMFLGSSLGNFDPLTSYRFLQTVRRLLAPGDHLLLGADLDKPEAQLLAAYDDALGVTAAFNLNLLRRMNRELGADFELSLFQHQVRFDDTRRNIEMHLESLCDQTVHFAEGGFVVTLCEGETIHTENSHKYELGELDDLTSGAGFTCVKRWCDDEAAFASALYTVV
jgi:L-histidine Nalpha-methyltransferase